MNLCHHYIHFNVSLNLVSQNDLSQDSKRTSFFLFLAITKLQYVVVCQPHAPLSYFLSESAKHMEKVVKHIWKYHVDAFGTLYTVLSKIIVVETNHCVLKCLTNWHWIPLLIEFSLIKRKLCLNVPLLFLYTTSTI